MAGLSLDLGGRAVPVTVRRSPLASRMSLRVDAGRDGLVLVLPDGVPEADGLRFAASKGDWIVKRLGALPPRVAFAAGAVVPVLGLPHELVHRPEARRGVWAEDGRLNVCGRPEHMARRVADWLKDQARREIAARAHPMAEAVGRRVAGLVVRDQRSRWGSCTSDGRLAFSWRLVLAPERVLTYVVAHEVAHLVEMNHSPAFWRVVHRLMPDSATPRHWLKLNGQALHRYG